MPERLRLGPGLINGCHGVDRANRLLAQFGGLDDLQVGAEPEKVRERLASRLDRHARPDPAIRIGYPVGSHGGDDCGAEQTVHPLHAVRRQPDHSVPGMQAPMEVGEVRPSVGLKVETGLGVETAVAG
jgi:hypothetical protein